MIEPCECLEVHGQHNDSRMSMLLPNVLAYGRQTRRTFSGEVLATRITTNSKNRDSLLALHRPAVRAAPC